MHKYKWSNELLPKLNESLSCKENTELRQKMIDDISNLQDTDKVSRAWSTYYTHCVEQVFENKKCKNKTKTRTQWIDDECIIQRKKVINEKKSH